MNSDIEIKLRLGLIVGRFIGGHIVGSTSRMNAKMIFFLLLKSSYAIAASGSSKIDICPGDTVFVLTTSRRSFEN